MKVLLYGSGAREHALADKICNSKLLEELYLANCGDGFLHLGEVIRFSGFDDLADKAEELKIQMLVVGPEEPLAQGICDVFLKRGIKVVGPDKYWAQLESSKIFAKEFMKRNGIATAFYVSPKTEDEFEQALSCCSEPPVIKLDGLAGGKGVFVCETLNETREKWLTMCGKKVLVEKRLYGREISVFSLWDSKTLLSFEPAADFKRLSDNDMGPNTGGMGAVFPIKNPGVKDYLKKLENALKKERADFCGVIYSGLIIEPDGKINVLEYNVRFGDPEIQALIQNWKNDILEVFDAMTEKKLDKIKLKMSDEPSYCVVLASKGYPLRHAIGAEIFNIDEAVKKYGVKIYFAGVKKTNGRYFVNGGRVLSICKSGSNALKDIYKACDLINFEGKIFRHDINFK